MRNDLLNILRIKKISSCEERDLHNKSDRSVDTYYYYKREKVCLIDPVYRNYFIDHCSER